MTTITYEKVKNLEVGKYEDWIKHSDHSPLIVDFELKKPHFPSFVTRG